MVNEDFGTDISWNKSETNLGTVSGNDNILQSIINRLNTDYGELNWVYNNYGCNFRDYLGLKADNNTLEFIKNSIKQSLDEEERINDYNLELSYLDGKIHIILKINGVDLEFDLGE